jgi:hypothetical protein
MHWFGEPWPSADLRASVCEDDLDRVPLPEGQTCPMCDNPVVQGDQGVVIPHLETLDASIGLTMTEIRYVHLSCLLMAVGL